MDDPYAKEERVHSEIRNSRISEDTKKNPRSKMLTKGAKRLKVTIEVRCMPHNRRIEVWRLLYCKPLVVLVLVVYREVMPFLWLTWFLKFDRLLINNMNTRRDITVDVVHVRSNQCSSDIKKPRSTHHKVNVLSN